MILPCFLNSLSLLSACKAWRALINFFGDFIVKFNQSNPLVPSGNLYYIAGSFGNPEIVNVVSDQEVFDCPDLYSTQEEVDNRMILQALHADKRLKELRKQGRIIIKTSDTDVIVLCIYFYKQMKTPETKFMSASLFSLTDRNFFQSGIFLPSMTLYGQSLWYNALFQPP
jgi:hypothetical protein